MQQKGNSPEERRSSFRPPGSGIPRQYSTHCAPAHPWTGQYLNPSSAAENASCPRALRWRKQEQRHWQRVGQLPGRRLSLASAFVRTPSSQLVLPAARCRKPSGPENRPGGVPTLAAEIAPSVYTKNKCYSKLTRIKVERNVKNRQFTFVNGLAAPLYFRQFLTMSCTSLSNCFKLLY